MLCLSMPTKLRDVVTKWLDMNCFKHFRGGGWRLSDKGVRLQLGFESRCRGFDSRPTYHSFLLLGSGPCVLTTHETFHASNTIKEMPIPPIPDKRPKISLLFTRLFFRLRRLGTLEKIVGRWSGPISLVIYLSDDELPTLEQHITASPFLADNGRLAVHLVYKEGVR